MILGEAGGNEGVNVCERWFRLGGARGPPGTEGGQVMLIGLEMVICVGGDAVCLDDVESNLPLPEAEDKEPEEVEMSVLLIFGLSFFDKLVFRPNEAKNPPLFEMDVDGARERIEEVGVPTLELERDGLVRGGFMAKEGYGRVRDTAVGVTSP